MPLRDILRFADARAFFIAAMASTCDSDGPQASREPDSERQHGSPIRHRARLAVLRSNTAKDGLLELNVLVVRTGQGSGPADRLPRTNIYSSHWRPTRLVNCARLRWLSIPLIVAISSLRCLLRHVPGSCVRHPSVHKLRSPCPPSSSRRSEPRRGSWRGPEPCATKR